MAGDEVLLVDGAPFAEIGSFKGKAGGIVRLQIRRSADAAPVIASVKVERLQPLETFLKAMSDSIRIV
jgi:C-terminal processing protease CtpA/Prc